MSNDNCKEVLNSLQEKLNKVVECENLLNPDILEISMKLDELILNYYVYNSENRQV